MLRVGGNMQSKALTVKDYLAELPEDRRKIVAAVRDVIRRNLDKEYEEGMQYGMIGYFVPHKVFPPGYHCDPKQPLPFVALASQKNHISLYLMSAYDGGLDGTWFREAWAKTGKKLDMGKCCIRFKRLDDLPLGLIGEAIRRIPARKHIAAYETFLTQAPAAKAERANKPKTTSRPVPKRKTKS